MDNWEKRLVRVCWKLKLNTWRLEKELEPFFEWSEGKSRMMPRQSEPDRLLDPERNGTMPLLEELGACLRHYLPEEMTDMGRSAMVRMCDESTEFIEYLERYVRFGELWDSSQLEVEIMRYVTRMPAHPSNRRGHQAKINQYMRRLRSCFLANSKAIYCEVTAIKNGKRGKASGGRKATRLERKVDQLVEVVANGEDRKFCWERLSEPRARQVRAVWQWLQDAENRSHPAFSMSFACCQAFIAVPGGYPNDRALYCYCHQHEIELM